MHIRLKITLIFTVITLALLAMISVFNYYLVFSARRDNIKERLANKALTTANMIGKPGIFDSSLLESIEQSIISPVTNKVIEVYDHQGNKLYSYKENPSDSVLLSNDLILKARRHTFTFYTRGRNEMIVYNDKNSGNLVYVSLFDVSGKKNLHELGLMLILFLLGGTFIAFAAGYYFSKKLIRPIRKIADEVNNISAQSLTHRIKTGTSDDDWNYLIATLNELLNRLQGSFEIQRRFISSASHELSTPLITISSQLEVCLQRERSIESYREVMQSVLVDVRHLINLTQTLLKFATVSGSGGIELNLIRIDEVLMQVPSEIKKLDNTYLVSITFDEIPEDEEKLLVFGNADLLLTAITNIVSNACKYSSDRLASIKLTSDPGSVIIRIADKGKGIPEHELENIFEPFYRTEDSRSVNGFGVGLPLVKRIIKLHNGSILVSSTVGHGTDFSISLPLAGAVSNNH